MSEIVIRINLGSSGFSPRLGRALMAAAMMFSVVPELASESVTLTTYYPAPSGVYTQMITTGNTFLARDASSNASQVTIGSTNSGTGQQLDVYSQKGSANNAAIRATYPGGGGLASTEFAALAHRSGFWSGLYANQGAASYAAYINGQTLINSGAIWGNYGITPSYQNWAAYGVGDGGAAIYNSAQNPYYGLMLVGNNSGGGGIRRVKVWDELTVNGNEYVTGSSAVANRLAVGIGQNYSPAARIDAGGTIIVREAGCFSAATGYSPASSGGTWGLCGGGTYVTMTSGVMSKRTELATSTDPNISALCCPCIGVCPGL